MSQIMRICLSFLVVEYMRHGKHVQEACRLAIQRLLQLQPPSGKDTMHTTLIAGVVAMDKDGVVGAASTVDSNNLHRGAPFFPVVFWKEGETAEPQVLQASVDGACV